MSFSASPGTARPAVPAGVRATGDGAADPTGLLPRRRPAARTAPAIDGSLLPAVTAPAAGASPAVRATGSTGMLARGRHLFRLLTALALGRMSRFAAVGAVGAVLNLVIMSALLGWGTHYLLAAIVATELTILGNFAMHERLVFHDLREGGPFWRRLLTSLGFNNAETLVRIPVLVFLVDLLLIPSLLAQAVTLAVAFLVRFAFTSRVIYRIRPVSSPVLAASSLEEGPVVTITTDTSTPVEPAPRPSAEPVVRVGCPRCDEARHGGPSCS